MNVYRIGNSFTWDSHPPSMDGVSQNTIVTTHSGYHVRCSSSLATIASDETTCVVPTSEGKWQQALEGYQWDYLVVQPFLSGNATLTSDKASIQTFVHELHTNPANANTKLLIYQSWAFQSGGPTWGNWLSSASQATDHRQDYYRDLQAALATEGIAAEIIPNADVLYYLVNHLGEFNSIPSLSSLYRDSLHMSPVGQFIQAITVLTYINGSDLTGTPKGSYGGTFTNAERDQLQTLIWKIVNTVQNPGDFNADGLIDTADYDLWVASYGSSAAGVDGNLDGIVDGADYTIWRDAFTAASSVSVPEPSATLLVTTLGVSFVTRRRVGRGVDAA